MKLTKAQATKYCTFLIEHKDYVGMHDWIIILKTELQNGSTLAHAEPDIMEKEIEITLSEEFLTKSKAVQCNILFHELIHGKVCAYNQQIREHISIMEEHFVNDITRGFEKALKWTEIQNT